MKLSEHLKQWRAERPSEWKMDEFIRAAELMELDVRKIESAAILKASKILTIQERIDDDMVKIIRPSALEKYAQELLK